MKTQKEKYMKKNITYYRPGSGFLEKGTFIDALTEKVIKVNHSSSAQAQAFTQDEIKEHNHHYKLTANFERVINIDELKTLHIMQNGAYPMGQVYTDDKNRECLNIDRSTIYFL